MIDIVQTPLARRLWRISKFFQIPINDPRIQNMDVYDLEFYEYSMIADDPDKLAQLKNHFYDPDYEDWVEEFEMEQAELADKTTQESPDNTHSCELNDNLDWDDYDVSADIKDDEWEEVN